MTLTKALHHRTSLFKLTERRHMEPQILFSGTQTLLQQREDILVPLDQQTRLSVSEQRSQLYACDIKIYK